MDDPRGRPAPVSGYAPRRPARTAVPTPPRGPRGPDGQTTPSPPWPTTSTTSSPSSTPPPRITPDPTFEGPAVSFDDRGNEDVASETLAKIYAAQHQYVEAAVVYERLAARTPDQADTLLARAAALRRKAG